MAKNKKAGKKSEKKAAQPQAPAEPMAPAAEAAPKKKSAPVRKKAPAAKKTAVKAAKPAPAPKPATAAKPAPAPKPAAKPKSITAPQTKLQILQSIADDTGLDRKQVASVFLSLGRLVQGHMQRRGSGEFAIPETGVKIRRVKRPATKARKGRNPATGEEITIAAKPAQNVIRVYALKALKDTLG